MKNGVALYTSQSESTLFEQHAGLVKRIAYHMIARLPASVDVEDLIQAGMIGLLDASHNFDASQNASFETYAGIRVRGAMLDEIRHNDWAPRSVHRKAREISEVIQLLEQRKGRNPTDTEIAKELDMSLSEYNQQLLESKGHQLFSLDEFTDNDEIDANPISAAPEMPDNQLQSTHFQNALSNAISELPEREKLLMSLYYNDELNLKEIGQVLGVSESRVSQLHSQAVIRLRSKLHDWVN